MKNIIWLHEDSLRETHPVFKQAPEDASAVFIWDETYLKTMNYGYNRLAFIYETLTQLPVRIYRGKTLNILQELAENNAAIYVSDTPNPELKDIIMQLTKLFEVNIIADEPFVTLERPVELKRFFRYWNKARRSAMRINGE